MYIYSEFLLVMHVVVVVINFRVYLVSRRVSVLFILPFLFYLCFLSLAMHLFCLVYLEFLIVVLINFVFAVSLVEYVALFAATCRRS
jgi:hypothetical protein